MEYESYRNFLGPILKAARLQKGLSQEAVAKKARVSKRFIQNLENGQHETLLSNILILSEAIEVSPLTLISQLLYAIEKGTLPEEVASILPPKKRGRPVTKKEPVTDTGPKRRPGRPKKNPHQ